MQLPRWLEEKMWIEAAHQIWKRLPGENFKWMCCTSSLSSQTLVLKHLAMWKVKPCSRSLAWIVTAKSSQAKQFRDSRLSYERKKGNKWDDRADYPALLDRCSCQLRCLQLILMLLNAANTLRNPILFTHSDTALHVCNPGGLQLEHEAWTLRAPLQTLSGECNDGVGDQDGQWSWWWWSWWLHDDWLLAMIMLVVTTNPLLRRVDWRERLHKAGNIPSGSQGT